MLRFSANLSMLFLEYSFLERFDKAAQSGFRGVEFMFPYDYDIDVLKEKLQTNQLEHTLHMVNVVLYLDIIATDAIY